MNKLISIDNISFDYNSKEVIKNLSFEVNSNDFIAVIGPNGCGKTTLINLIINRLTPSKGTIEYVNGFEISEIGYVPQHSNIDRLFPISLNEIVLSGLQGRKGFFQGYTKHDIKKRDEIMERFFIKKLGTKSVGLVSGGELQRAYICRALISEPKALILDEPDTYIDKETEINLYEIIKKANDSMAIILVSHSLHSVEQNAKTIIKMRSDCSWSISESTNKICECCE